MVLTNVDTGFAGAGFKDNFGNLWIRQEWDSYIPITPGEKYNVTSRVEDVYSWRDRTVVKQEVNLWSPGGELMAKAAPRSSIRL